ncbi:MAG: cell division protein ZapA [Bacteroidia bacterium]
MESNPTEVITVEIDGKSMRLRVAETDRDSVIGAAELLNKRIEGFKKFGTSDPMDRMTWAALDLAGDVFRQKNGDENVQISQTSTQSDFNDSSIEYLEELESMLKDF